MVINGEEIFFIPYDKDKNKIIIYVPLRSYLALADISIEKFLQDDTSEIYNEFFDSLKRRVYIDPIEIHKCNTKVLPQLSIPITDNCNLKCGYCYFRAGDDDRKSAMSREQIKACVDAYVVNINNYPVKLKNQAIDIAIAGGGEPTVEFELFKFAVLYIEEKLNKIGIKPRFSMPTNGAYGQPVREFILKHFFQISFSMDGPEFIQNVHRPYRNGAGSFEKVFETAKFFYENKMNMAFRITVTDYSLPHLIEILNFFDAEFKGICVGIEAMNLFGRAVNNSKLNPPDPQKYSEALVKAYKYAQERGIKVKNASTGKFECLRTVFCGAVGIPNWTVTCDGRVTSCTRDNAPDEFTFGKFNMDTLSYDIDQDKVAKLRNMSVLYYEDCKDCFCKYNCAGDCPDLRVAKMLNCDATRSVGKFILNNKF